MDPFSMNSSALNRQVILDIAAVIGAAYRSKAYEMP
jgi:hypothetical protein